MFLLLSPAVVILSRFERFDVNDNLLLIVWNVSSSIDFHFAGEICSLLVLHVFPVSIYICVYIMCVCRRMKIKIEKKEK
mgnify:CR=1 FL=1